MLYDYDCRRVIWESDKEILERLGAPGACSKHDNFIGNINRNCIFCRLFEHYISVELWLWMCSASSNSWFGNRRRHVAAEFSVTLMGWTDCVTNHHSWFFKILFCSKRWFLNQCTGSVFNRLHGIVRAFRNDWKE